MSRVSNVFVRLEKFIGSKYPSFLKNILLNFGFDCESALILLNEDKITKIERDLVTNPELLKDTVYDKKTLNPNDEFKFLIGHRELLLNIPETIRQKNQKTQEKKRSKNNKKPQSNEESGTELGTELDVEDLSKRLITKINSFFENKNFDCEITVEHIDLLALTDDGAECTVKCLFCDSSIKNLYKSNWHISNYIQHTLRHSELIKLRPKAQLNQNPNQNPTQIQPGFQRANENVLTVVEQILSTKNNK